MATRGCGLLLIQNIFADSGVFVTNASSTGTELELELTFLAGSIPDEITGVRPQKIVDAYFPHAVDAHPRVRLRQQGDRFEFTKKTPAENGDASQHFEQTISLTAEEFSDLSISSRRRITKDRYKVALNGYEAEVDVFQGPLEGLILIDFEFSSLAEMSSFVAPECCGPDVTQEDFIAGGLLAGRSYQDIQPELHRLGYESLIATEAHRA